MSDIDSTLISGEQIVLKTEKHWIAPVADSKWAVLMIIGALVLAWLQTDATTGVFGFFNRVMGLIQTVLVLGGIGWIIYNIVAWRTAEYYVTNRRVFGHEGLVRSRATDTLLTSVADVAVKVSFLGKSLGYGNIRITSASGSAGEDTFTSMRGVDAFKKEILEQKSGTAALAESRMTAPAAAADPAAAAPVAASAAPATDVTATLAQLATLRDSGAITPEEFEAKKTELLSRI